MPVTEAPATRRKRNIFFHTGFNLNRLLSLAERLRRQPCTCNDSQTPKAGALNWTIFLEFDDGVEWVFRAPCSTYATARGVTGRLLASEVATLEYIREHTSIPVPEVFHFSSRRRARIRDRRREGEYFNAVSARRLALASKVTLAAEMNPRFVADGRLWRWIDAVVEYYDEGPGIHGAGAGSNSLV